MSSPFENIRVVDATHVLAGPFATYQMAVLGADVIKVESPSDPDQARMQGSDRALNDQGLGTAFMSQASNKKAVAIDFKNPQGREALNPTPLPPPVGRAYEGQQFAIYSKLLL